MSASADCLRNRFAYPRHIRNDRDPSDSRSTAHGQSESRTSMDSFFNPEKLRCDIGSARKSNAINSTDM
jgi:hypothetical protein